MIFVFKFPFLKESCDFISQTNMLKLYVIIIYSLLDGL